MAIQQPARVKNAAQADRRVELGDAGAAGAHAIMDLGGATIVHVVHRPGWRWSTHIRQAGGAEWCQVAHVGYTISGCEHVRLQDGTEFDLRSGDAYVVPPGRRTA